MFSHSFLQLCPTFPCTVERYHCCWFISQVHFYPQCNHRQPDGCFFWTCWSSKLSCFLIRCHDFCHFPPFLCLSPKRPHLFTQPMTCFPFPFYTIFTTSYLILSPHLLSYLLNQSFRIYIKDNSVYSACSETRILRSTKGVLSTGKPLACQTPPYTCG